MHWRERAVERLASGSAQFNGFDNENLTGEDDASIA
jgi:hypothetical protein